jgi:hypothetical protein
MREVMRQLSRPFGYAWLRSKKEGREYKYELVQDLRSQLLEEELRNKDRNAALIALEREMSRYRPYLHLSPDGALARARAAAPGDRPLLENLAGTGWGPIQMYFRLSPPEMAALRSGETLNFRQEPRPGEPLPPHMDRARDQPLSPEVARSVLQSLRSRRVVRRGDRYWNAAPDDPAGVPLTAVPEARALISLKLNQGELGQFSVTGNSGFVIYNEPGGQMTLSLQGHGPYAVGQSPTVLEPDNRSQNAELARDPALRPRISIRPEPSCQARPSEELAQPPTPQRKCTSADVLEALHRETGMPIVADFYTRLHYLDRVSVKDQTLFAALSHLADAMRLRWKKEGEWLHFRSASYYDDRLKEVPNRLLSRWAASRRQHGLPALEDLLEIARLSDAQLDAADMAEGARECWGLREWNLPRGRFQRSHLRFLAHLTPAQRQEAASSSSMSRSSPRCATGRLSRWRNWREPACMWPIPGPVGSRCRCQDRRVARSEGRPAWLWFGRRPARRRFRRPNSSIRRSRRRRSCPPSWP